MVVVLLHNPDSGKGRGGLIAGQVAGLLRDAGHTVCEVRARSEHTVLVEALRGAASLVVVGGDGTVHHALTAAAESGAALFHVPTGTENLFAREFGMKRDAGQVAAALESGGSEAIDLGRVRVIGAAPRAHTTDARRDGPRGNDQTDAARHFAIMCSIGPDAGVVRRLAAARTGSISRLTYLAPIFAELRDIRIPRVTIEADGKRIVHGLRGMVIVANMKQYGWRLDFAPRADRADGLLDIAFMPAQGATAMLAWLALARLGLHTRSRGFIGLRAKRVRIVTDDTRACWQVDGEAGDGVGAMEMTCEVVPRALRVAKPSSERR